MLGERLRPQVMVLVVVVSGHPDSCLQGRENVTARLCCRYGGIGPVPLGVTVVLELTELFLEIVDYRFRQDEPEDEKDTENSGDARARQDGDQRGVHRSAPPGDPSRRQAREAKGRGSPRRLTRFGYVGGAARSKPQKAPAASPSPVYGWR